MNQPKKIDSTSLATGRKVDSDMANMRRMVRQSLGDLNDEMNRLTDEYMREAQPLVDEISQRMYDMASGAPIYRAVADNLKYLMDSNVSMLDAPAMGKRNLKPLSFSRLGEGNSQLLSRPALKQANETSGS